MSDFRDIMENWRSFKDSKKDWPSDGHKPADPSIYGVHFGGETGKIRSTANEPKGAPIKNRRQVSVYPKPGSMFDTKTGKINVAAAEELLVVLDQDKDLMKSSADPYVDDWLERTHNAFISAIRAFQEKGKKDQEALDQTLDAKFKSAIHSIRGIIKARYEDTLDIDDPSADFHTSPGFPPTNINNS